MSSTDYPRSNGKIERVNQIIEDIIRANQIDTTSPFIRVFLYFSRHTLMGYSAFSKEPELMLLLTVMMSQSQGR
jgi:hypothetical protein